MLHLFSFLENTKIFIELLFPPLDGTTSPFYIFIHSLLFLRMAAYSSSCFSMHSKFLFLLLVLVWKFTLLILLKNYNNYKTLHERRGPKEWSPYRCYFMSQLNRTSEKLNLTYLKVWIPCVGFQFNPLRVTTPMSLRNSRANQT